jgi:hypothetical protein
LAGALFFRSITQQDNFAWLIEIIGGFLLPEKEKQTNFKSLNQKKELYIE